MAVDWSRIVFDHVKVGVSDLDASLRFYETVLEPLGIPPLWQNERGAQFANLVISPQAEPSGPVHIAFVAESRDQVDRFHRAGVEAGHRDNGAPGVREQYSSEEGAATTRRSCSIRTATTSKPSAASSEASRIKDKVAAARPRVRR